MTVRVRVGVRVRVRVRVRVATVGERLLERGPDVGQGEAEGRLQPGG